MNSMSTQEPPSPLPVTMTSSPGSSSTDATNLMADLSILGQANSSNTTSGLSSLPEPPQGSIDPSSRAPDAKVNRKPVDYGLVSNMPKSFQVDAYEGCTYNCNTSPRTEVSKPINSEVVIDYSDMPTFSSLLTSVLNFRKDAEKMFWRTAELEGRIRNCAYAREGWELRPVMSRFNGKTVPEGCDVVSVIFVYTSAS